VAWANVKDQVHGNAEKGQEFEPGSKRLSSYLQPATLQQSMLFVLSTNIAPMEVSFNYCMSPSLLLCDKNN
jgi:hypothetical protein